MSRTRIIYIFLSAVFALNLQAQALAQDTVRQRNWPVGVPMDEETIEWRQDVYKELNLEKPHNTGLYSGANQEDGTTGLFAKIFELSIAKKIDLYKYEIDGNERLTKRNQTNIKTILDDFHINYTSENDIITINKSDIPYAEVTTFYLKEATYYDAVNSTFSTRVIALCPVIIMEDEFSDEPVRYPLFWVKYEQLEKYLHDIYTIPDYRNVARKIPMAEYFALNLYEGDIYKVYNAYGSVLIQQHTNDTTLNAERKNIIEKMQRIKRSTYNIYYSEAKAAQQQTQDKPKEKIKYRWIFPWQKKKALKAATKAEEKKEENDIFSETSEKEDNRSENIENKE